MIRRKSEAAFTIVELLIAASITVLIVVLLGTMFGSLTQTTSRANQRIDAFRDARAALQMMQRDLSGLVRTQWQPDPFASPAPTVPPQPLTRPSAYLALKNIYADSATGNQQIYALIALKNSGSSDVCSVGYYCSWDGTYYTLRRFFRDSSSTYGTLSSPSPGPAESPGAVYISDTSLYRPNPSPSPVPTDDVLAQYVWNLKITAYDKSGAIINTSPSYICDSSATTPVQPPAVLEISFRAMSSEAARTVIASGASASVWMNESDPTYLRLIKPHAYEFRTRINCDAPP